MGLGFRAVKVSLPLFLFLNQDQMVALGKAMFGHEAGVKLPYTDEQYMTGYQRATGQPAGTTAGTVTPATDVKAPVVAPPVVQTPKISTPNIVNNGGSFSPVSAVVPAGYIGGYDFVPLGTGIAVAQPVFLPPSPVVNAPDLEGSMLPGSGDQSSGGTNISANFSEQARSNLKQMMLDAPHAQIMDLWNCAQMPAATSAQQSDRKKCVHNANMLGGQ